MVLLAAWCALRFGELAELRRKDVDLTNGVIHVRRAVVRVDGRTLVGTPKTDAGIRDVAIPPHLVPAAPRPPEGPRRSRAGTGCCSPATEGTPGALDAVRQGTDRDPGRERLLPARAAAGRPDLRFHDLRHTGAVLAASTGATLAELMARLGHSTPGAALRYQHAAQDRDQVIADALSALVNGGRS